MAGVAGAEVERGELGDVGDGLQKREKKKEEEHKGPTIESILRSRGLTEPESWWFKILTSMLLHPDWRDMMGWKVEPWLLGGPAGRQIVEIAARELKVPVVRSSAHDAIFAFCEHRPFSVCEWDALAGLDFTHWARAVRNEMVEIRLPFHETVGAVFAASTFICLPDGAVPPGLAEHAALVASLVVSFTFAPAALTEEEAAAVAATVGVELQAALGQLPYLSSPCSIFQLLPSTIRERSRGLFGHVASEVDHVTDKVAAMDVCS